jgi:SPP1 family predicted phage head-tail adaptor
VRSGNLRYLIDIYRKQTERDEYGGSVEDWQHCTQARADVKNVSGAQSTVNDELLSIITLQIIIRSSVPISSTDRIKYNCDWYMIDFIQPDRTTMWHTITAIRINE